LSKLVYLFQTALFFTFLDTVLEFGGGIQSSSCSGNHQTYLHTPGCYDYRADVYE